MNNELDNNGLNNNQQPNPMNSIPTQPVQTNIPPINPMNNVPPLEQNQPQNIPPVPPINNIPVTSTPQTAGESIQPINPMNNVPNTPVEQSHIQNTPHIVPPNVAPSNNYKGEHIKKYMKYALFGLVGLIIIIFAIKIIKGTSSGGKTLTCSNHYVLLGIDAQSTYIFRIEEKKISRITVETVFNLENFSASSTDVDSWAKEKIAADKNECSINSGCRYSHTYNKGKMLKETITYNDRASEELVGSNIMNYSADEIYNKLKTNYETQLYYTCE